MKTNFHTWKFIAKLHPWKIVSPVKNYTTWHHLKQTSGTPPAPPHFRKHQRQMAKFSEFYCWKPSIEQFKMKINLEGSPNFIRKTQSLPSSRRQNPPKWKTSPRISSLYIKPKIFQSIPPGWLIVQNPNHQNIPQWSVSLKLAVRDEGLVWKFFFAK